MDIKIIATPDYLKSERLEQDFDRLKSNFDDANMVFLRRSFDNSITDTAATAAIRIAKLNGFHQLASEMEADYLKRTRKDLRHV